MENLGSNSFKTAVYKWAHPCWLSIFEVKNLRFRAFAHGEDINIKQKYFKSFLFASEHNFCQGLQHDLRNKFIIDPPYYIYIGLSSKKIRITWMGIGCVTYMKPILVVDWALLYKDILDKNVVDSLWNLNLWKNNYDNWRIHRRPC